MPDLLGLNQGFKPKFVKRFADLHSTITSAVTQYSSEVKARSFPAVEHTFYAKADSSQSGSVPVPQLEN